MKSKMIVGYKGSADMNLAIQNGEVDGRVVSDESALLYGPSSGMRIIASLARKRTALLPDVPTVFEAARMPAEGARLIDWRAGIAGLGRVVLTTPGTPPDRVEVLRVALAGIIRDPGFVAEVKRFNLSPNYADAGEVRAAVEKAMTTLGPAELKEIREIALDRYY